MSRQAAIRRHAARFSRQAHTQPIPDGTSPPWSARTFGLDRVPAFKQAGDDNRQAVLLSCARNLLTEAWCIEQRGIAYCSSMQNQAETAAESEMFACIGADETRHSEWLSPWLPGPAETDPFNRYIDGLLEAGSPQSLAFLLQVVLEGFGISHYHSLAEGCRDKALKQTLRRLSIDEALHYAGGLLVFQPERLADWERQFIIDGTQAFLQMIRIGPQSVVGALVHHAGAASVGELAGVFSVLESEATAAAKLARLRTLISRPGMSWLMERLEAGGLFEPCTPVQCARQFQDQPT